MRLIDENLLNRVLQHPKLDEYIELIASIDPKAADAKKKMEKTEKMMKLITSETGTDAGIFYTAFIIRVRNIQ